MELGDKVTIRRDAVYRSLRYVVPEMHDFLGTTGVICSILPYCDTKLYQVGKYYWEECQLDLLDEEADKPILNYGGMEMNKLINELTLLYLQKNKDYGNSVQVTYDVFGQTSTLTRISDKINRLKSLRTKEAEVEESIDDTVRDLINYWGIHRSMESETKLATFVSTITDFLKFPNYELSNIKELVSEKILDNDTLNYIATHITNLLD